MKEANRDKKIIIGVDRLDYIKGIPNKITGFQKFLEMYPDFSSKVILIQVAVPSRTDVQEYVQLKDFTFELAGRCNATFGNPNYSPLQLINNSVDFDELSALYQIADVCLITSLRDGMNLVAYEYVMSQKINHGVLVISEFAGASSSLSGSVTLNPWDAEDIADKIYYALALGQEERMTLSNRLSAFVEEHSAKIWGEGFVKQLMSLTEFKEDADFDMIFTHPKHLAFVHDNHPSSCIIVIDDRNEASDDLIPVYWEENCLRPDEFKMSNSRSWNKLDLNNTTERVGLEELLKTLEIFENMTPGTRVRLNGDHVEWTYDFGDRELWNLQVKELQETFQKLVCTNSIQVHPTKN